MSPECVGVALIASFLRQGVQGFSWHMGNCKLVSSRWVFLSQPEVSLSPAPIKDSRVLVFQSEIPELVAAIEKHVRVL